MTHLWRAIRKRWEGGTANSLLLAPRFPRFAIGRASYGDLKVIEFGEGTVLRMGNYCSVASGVQVMLGGGHRTDWVTTYPFGAMDAKLRHITGHPQSKGNVTIGNDVWIGREAMILSGVTIGDGAVIGARAIVPRDVPPYAIVAGNPARLIRYRFSSQVVERLLALRWWNWPEERIARALPHLLNDDITGFLDAAERGAL